ncbi:MAG: HAD family phosphatase [Verrucomicrobiota bacterium]
MFRFPKVDFDGYLFDCDGTLVNSMPVHYKAWCEALKEHDAPYGFPKDLFYDLGGTATDHIVNILNEKYGGNLDAKEVAHTKEKLFMERVCEVEPIGPVVSLAREVSRDQKVAVVSGGFRRVVMRLLESVGLVDTFKIVVTPADVAKGKPAPDMFLLAAGKLGVAPERCLVLEDGIMGVRGAAAAGMCSYLIPRLDLGEV